MVSLPAGPVRADPSRAGLEETDRSVERSCRPARFSEEKHAWGLEGGGVFPSTAPVQKAAPFGNLARGGAG